MTVDECPQGAVVHIPVATRGLEIGRFSHVIEGQRANKATGAAEQEEIRRGDSAEVLLEFILGHTHLLVVLIPQIRRGSFADSVDNRCADHGPERLGRVDDHRCPGRDAGALPPDLGPFCAGQDRLCVARTD